MAQPQDNIPPSPPPQVAPPTNRLPPAPRQRSCVGQLFGLVGWLLTLLLSAALALAAAAALLYFYFGFTLATPGQIRQASSDIDTLRQQNQALQTEVAQLSSTDAEQSSAAGTDRERIDELESLVANYEQQAAEMAGQAATAAALAQDLEENIALAATIQAEGRENKVLMSVIATVQVDNSSRLSELQRRTDRIARFLQRLGDLSADIAAEETMTPTATTAAIGATPVATATP